MKNNFQTPIVLLVNGKFPSHPAPMEILKSAKTIICTDGSANSLIQFGIEPQIIIGDLDSLKIDKNLFTGTLIHEPNQNNTDFEKALVWALENYVSDLNILGSTGLREDHSLANYFIFSEYSSKMNLKLVTNHFTITCHDGTRTFESKRGHIVSIFAIFPQTVVSTQFLKYPLLNSVLNPSCRTISNKSLASQFQVESNKPILVFHSHDIF